MTTRTKCSVHTAVQRAGRTLWLKIGTGVVGDDGSIDVHLDALPASGFLQVRHEELDARRAGVRS